MALRADPEGCRDGPRSLAGFPVAAHCAEPGAPILGALSRRNDATCWVCGAPAMGAIFGPATQTRGSTR
jgi:hypothetical protein